MCSLYGGGQQTHCRPIALQCTELYCRKCMYTCTRTCTLRWWTADPLVFNDQPWPWQQMQQMHVNTWLQWHWCPLVARLVPIRLHSTSSHSTVRSCSKPNIFHCKTMVKYIVLTKLPSDSIALHPHHLCRAAAVPIHCKCTMYNLLQHSGYWSVSRPISLQWSALAPTTASNNKSYVLLVEQL